MSRRVMTLVGARPQFIKAAPVSGALRAAGLVEILVHSGQHYDAAMSDRFFDELGIPAPAHHLGVGSGSHADQTGRILVAVERLISAERPDWVLVYGDTNTTLGGALAAAEARVPVAHVEAGLRSGNMAMPEEINRIVTDRLSQLLFAPTTAALEQLVLEGVPRANVRLTGDVMLDAALAFGERAARRSGVLRDNALEEGHFILATVHRAENTDDPSRLAAILGALGAAGHPVCLPLHPRTARRLADGGISVPPAIRVIEPVGYLDMLRLLGAALIVVTDSGGVQKESYFMRTPCVTVRTETEWGELVAAGWNRIADPREAGTVLAAIDAAIAAGRPPEAPSFYGDGSASRLIAEALAEP